ncbi:unnamed protein product [Chondrus crispus]|uniref:Thioredoxin domain-containing protein n=1 Tax=Chondrus crispus TaxID=2769 RepID=R7QEM7_CHOCR|nr:unnamed protein product [Chondrus crispus]CDF36504.1 unnamed protein product [Chondrus crispus]|eukprot:XP_005716323.1 unnamed protein product [Chondrus crispus]
MIRACTCFYANRIPTRHTTRFKALVSKSNRPSFSDYNASVTSLDFQIHLPRYSRAKLLASGGMYPISTSNAEPFSRFFARYFEHHHPAIATHLRTDRAAFAAAVFLYRFDRRISPEFTKQSLDSIARAISECSGKSLPESRRLFAAAAKNASREYFSHGWDDINPFIQANTPVLLDLQRQSTKLNALSKRIHDAPEPAPEVDPVALRALADIHQLVLVLVYADYCSTCTALRPVFEKAAHLSQGPALFVKLNGPLSPQFKLYYDVSTYPTILRFEGPDNVSVVSQGSSPIDVDDLVAHAEDNHPGELTIDPDLMSSTDYGDAQSDDEDNPRRWVKALKRQGIDEIDELNSVRSTILRSKLDHSPDECQNASCKLERSRSRSRSHDTAQGDAPPVCVLLGGGMGAGKTTALGLIRNTPFWKEHGDDVVVVEADAFKMSDPLFHVLRSITPKAARIVHHDSVTAAEELFLQAVNSRRDVVFDGTMSWGEYAQQTVKMLTDTDYLYKRGPGYRKESDGKITEVYWVRSAKRMKPAPAYRVELVGVTADAETSVMRGIVRRITDGRGVAVPDQLHSHALFSKNFESYIEIMDAIYLFDTTMSSDVWSSKPSYEQQLVAIKPGLLFQSPSSDFVKGKALEGFAVRITEAYEQFLRKKLINPMASGAANLYVKVPITP